MGTIFLRKKKRLRQRTHKLGASKILVPRKNGEPERRSLSVCRGARGAAGPPPGGLEAPQEEQGVWGAAPSHKLLHITKFTHTINGCCAPNAGLQLSCPKMHGITQ